MPSLPRNGAYVLDRVHDDASRLAGLSLELGITKQAISQLIDIMVMRGYLERTADAGDRRRMLLTLTPRGQAAAKVAREAATEVDEELERRLSAEGVATLRASLKALAGVAVPQTPARPS
jgi:DNA-binding MarR family transcriptional regulator